MCSVLYFMNRGSSFLNPKITIKFTPQNNGGMNSVIQILRDNLPALKAKYPLASLGVYGSYSRDEQTTESDLDVLYETLPNTFLDLHKYFGLQRDLASLTHLKVDLVNKKYMNEVIWLRAKHDIIYV